LSKNTSNGLSAFIDRKRKGGLSPAGRMLHKNVLYQALRWAYEKSWDSAGREQ